MELSRTINSDKRYYLDENTIENATSFLDLTMGTGTDVTPKR